MERRQATIDDGDDWLSCPLGATDELAEDGNGISNQLGIGVLIRQMVLGVGLVESPAERGWIDWRGPDPLGTWHVG